MVVAATKATEAAAAAATAAVVVVAFIIVVVVVVATILVIVALVEQRFSTRNKPVIRMSTSLLYGTLKQGADFSHVLVLVIVTLMTSPVACRARTWPCVGQTGQWRWRCLSTRKRLCAGHRAVGKTAATDSPVYTLLLLSMAMMIKLTTCCGPFV